MGSASKQSRDDVTSTPQEAIAHYLLTGKSDVYAGWGEGTFFERAQRATTDLKSALIAEVRQRARVLDVPPEIPALDSTQFSQGKLAPMVAGLFPANEREAVLRMFARSIVLLTPEHIERVIAEAHWLETAWTLANIYLESIGAPALGQEPIGIVGLSEETTCYVSIEYFSPRNRFADFVVHEAAHVFHNCKRGTIGLPETRRREWLLDIAYGKRETFAYACEAYSRLCELAASRGARRQLFEDLAGKSVPADDTVDPAEYLDILREAVSAQHGWKRILARCAPRRKPSQDGGTHSGLI